MIQKTYTEGICLTKEGPKSTTRIKSSCNQNAEKSYITAVTFVPKLVPKRTFYTTEGVLTKSSSAIYNRACSISNGEKSYESSVCLDQNQIADPLVRGLEVEGDLPYYQNIELEPGLVIKDYSETVHNFPKGNSYLCNTTFEYDPSYTKENYIVGLEIQKVREVTFPLPEDESSFFTSSMHVAVMEDAVIEKGIMNGECDSPSILNGI